MTAALTRCRNSSRSLDSTDRSLLTSWNVPRSASDALSVMQHSTWRRRLPRDGVQRGARAGGTVRCQVVRRIIEHVRSDVAAGASWKPAVQGRRARFPHPHQLKPSSHRLEHHPRQRLRLRLARYAGEDRNEVDGGCLRSMVASVGGRTYRPWTFVRSAPSNVVPSSFALVKFAPRKSAPAKFAPIRIAP